jgi:hypothetical protein
MNTRNRSRSVKPPCHRVRAMLHLLGANKLIRPSQSRPVASVSFPLFKHCTAPPINDPIARAACRWTLVSANLQRTMTCSPSRMLWLSLES